MWCLQGIKFWSQASYLMFFPQDLIKLLLTPSKITSSTQSWDLTLLNFHVWNACNSSSSRCKREGGRVTVIFNIYTSWQKLQVLNSSVFKNNFRKLTLHKQTFSSSFSKSSTYLSEKIAVLYINVLPQSIFETLAPKNLIYFIHSLNEV